MDGFLCPKCGKKKMNKHEIQKGKYTFICEICGFKQGMMPKDHKRGVR